MSAVIESRASMPPGVYALTAGAFGIGATEFVIMGLLIQVAADRVGAPLLTAATVRLSRDVQADAPMRVEAA